MDTNIKRVYISYNDWFNNNKLNKIQKCMNKLIIN